MEMKTTRKFRSDGPNESAPNDCHVLQNQQQHGNSENRSSYGTAFGAEFPAAVYYTVIAAFAWMLGAAWLAFGANKEIGLSLAIATVLCIVFLALPVIMYRMPAARSRVQRPDLKTFLTSRVETATGSLSAREAWLQVALIPLALAVAATIIGSIYVWL
jgi:hypothetical protein